jgi:SAM-dependent methyltransferase
MPRIAKTIVPRIRKSLRERGVATSLCRSFLLPLHLLREYRAAKDLGPDGYTSEFDRAHGVNTEGEIGGWTYLSDLEIASQNWIEGNNYAAIEPERFNRVLASPGIAFEGYTFVDFGSGKGRALLLASEFPFTRIIGLEFSPELHRIATDNIQRYSSPTQKCRKIESLVTDFVDFALPPGPVVLFFFDPCRLHVLKKVVEGMRQSWTANRRPMVVAYVAARDNVAELFAKSGFLEEVSRSEELDFIVYASVA